MSDRTELERRLLINERCLEAMLSVSECFSNPDPGHQEAIASVERAIDTCEEKLGDDDDTGIGAQAQ